MATVVVSNGSIKIPTEIRKKYRIKSGLEVVVADENGVITIRPTLGHTVKTARRNLKRGA